MMVICPEASPTGSTGATFKGTSLQSILTTQTTPILSKKNDQPTESMTVSKAGRNTSAELYEALASAKLWMADVAMHFKPEVRQRVFKQIDLLHDESSWMEGDEPMLLESFKGFLLFLLSIKGASKPSIALTPAGHVIAIWHKPERQLSIEFRERDHVMWTVRLASNSKPDITSGCSSRDDLFDRLAPYSPEAWFHDSYTKNP